MGDFELYVSVPDSDFERARSATTARLSVAASSPRAACVALSAGVVGVSFSASKRLRTSSMTGVTTEHPFGLFAFILASNTFCASPIHEVIVPPPPSREEAYALAMVHWARDLETLMLAIGGAVTENDPIHFTMGCLGDEGAWYPPFCALAVTHAQEASFALDFVRSWLNVHAAYPMATLARASLDELRVMLAAAKDSPRTPQDPHPSRSLHAQDFYDGSLTKSDVERLIAMPPAEIFRALEAVTLPAREMSTLLQTGEAMIAALENGAQGVPVRLIARKIHFAPYLRRFANGAVMLHAGRFQRLWTVYRDAAALLLT